MPRRVGAVTSAMGIPSNILLRLLPHANISYPGSGELPGATISYVWYRILPYAGNVDSGTSNRLYHAMSAPLTPANRVLCSSEEVICRCWLKTGHELWRSGK